MTAIPTIAGMKEAEVLEMLYDSIGRHHLTQPQLLIGVGDDAAIVAAPTGNYVVSTDTMIQNYDFMLRWPNATIQPAASVGFKAIAQNVSDLNAMGANTTGIFLSLSLPPETTVEWLKDFGAGISQALVELGADKAVIAGGDLGKANSLVVTVTVTGELVEEPLLRSEAKIDDHIYICGNLGTSAAALQRLLNKDQPSSVEAASTQFFPRPRLEAGPLAARRGVRCGMDLSDGLIQDLGRLLSASGPHLQASLDVSVLSTLLEPLRENAQLLNENPWSWILGGGEDYALLITAPSNIELPSEFLRIGSVTQRGPDEELIVLLGQEHSEYLRATEAVATSKIGWEHFH